MKKIIASFLVLIIVLGLIGCNKKQDVKDEVVLKFGVLTLDNTKKTGIKDYERVGENAPTEEEKKIIKEGIKNAGGFIHYDNLTAGILSLDRGDIDTFHIPEPVADYIMKQHKNKYRKVRARKLYDCLVMATTKNKEDILNEINAGFKMIKKDGKYDDIYNKYIVNLNTEVVEAIPHFDDAKTIKVAVTGDIPPFDYIDANGKPQGFNIALLSSLADAMHVNFELVNCESGARAMTASSEKADVIFWMTGLAEDENGKNIDYSEDIPDNMVASDSYAIAPRTFIFLDSNNRIKEMYEDRIVK